MPIIQLQGIEIRHTLRIEYNDLAIDDRVMTELLQRIHHRRITFVHKIPHSRHQFFTNQAARVRRQRHSF
jgi:hypothetical protein